MHEIGVCVTGEARYFAYESVRASLETFVRTLDALAIRLEIARKGSASCSGFQMKFFPDECKRLKRMYLRIPEHDLITPLSGTRTVITARVVNVSSCEGHQLHSHACCNVRGNLEPGSFLQYFVAQRCVDWLFDTYPLMTHVIRTRPDVMYEHPFHTATLVRKLASRNGSACRNKYDARRSAYSDIFTFIRREDRNWYVPGLQKMHKDCEHGMPVSRFPENYAHGACSGFFDFKLNKVGVAGLRVPQKL